MQNRRAIGSIGEDMAIPHLENAGYFIVERNATFLGGELDIICKKWDMWRFVEVKYRANDYFWYPEDAMTPKKVKTLLRAIELYCFKKGIDYAMTRLDFLGIMKLQNGEFEYRLIEDVN